MSGHEEFRAVANGFNRMAERLAEYRASTLNDILAAKKFLEAIVNSIDEPDYWPEPGTGNSLYQPRSADRSQS